MFFIPRQYSWDYTGMNMSVENNMLHLLCQTNLNSLRVNLSFKQPIFKVGEIQMFTIC